jgi:hypothetical protein
MPEVAARIIDALVKAGAKTEARDGKVGRCMLNR